MTITTLLWLGLLILACSFLLVVLQQRKQAESYSRRTLRKPAQPSVNVKINVQFKRKPPRVIKKIIYLKAMSKHYSCRQIAETFNRLHSKRTGVTISKSFVAYTIKKHKHQIQSLRNNLKHKRPNSLPKNTTWQLI